MMNVKMPFLLLLLLSSCSYLQDDVAQHSKFNPIISFNFKVGYTETIDPLIWQDNIIYTPNQRLEEDLSSSSSILSLEMKDFTVNWQWNSTKSPDYEYFHSFYSNHIINSDLYISAGRTYSINLLDGSIKWDSSSGDYKGGRLYYYKNFLYTNVVYDADQASETIVKAHINSGAWEEVLKVQGNDSIRVGLRGLIFETDLQGYEIITYTNTELHRYDNNNVYPFLVKYNLTQDSIIYKKQIVEKGWTNAVDHVSEIIDGKIYVSALNKLICMDYETGEEVWRIDLDGNLVRSGFIFADNGNIYANTEFNLYCIKANNGNVQWQKESKAGSRLQFHKEVLYYIGGAKFNAIDATTGEKLLSFEAPSRADDDGAFFQPVMTIDHDNDRIYTASYTHAYCYPTLR